MIYNGLSVSSSFFNAYPNFQLTTPDVAFHNWCSDAGIIINDSVKVITTSQSVAGRGVFAIDDLQQGELVARIPTEVMLTTETGREFFPDIAVEIERSVVKVGMDSERDSQKSRIYRMWRKIRRKKSKQYYLANINDLWQPELTLYALEALKEDHPWSDWILQWSRDDPTYNLFASSAKPFDEDTIISTADELQQISPYLNHLHLRAALGIKLGRLEEERDIVPLNDNRETSEMYAMLGSRAGDMGDGRTGVIPFHDMINHSLEPNICIDYESEFIDIYANCEISQGEELFLCYTKEQSTMTSTGALWALVQWGIPTPLSRINLMEDEF